MMISAFIVHTLWENMTEAGYHSCVASIASKIHKLNSVEVLAANNKEWKILSESDVNFLMSQVQGYDCGGVDNQTFDPWSNRINIALKTTDIVEIIVWSNGVDEISGTDDDLVIPYGEKVPQ